MKEISELHTSPRIIEDPALSAVPGLSIAVLANNKQILTSGLDFHLCLWDIETGTCSKSWDAHGPIYSITVDHAAGIALLGAVQGIVLWNLNRWELCPENTLWSHSLIAATAYCQKTGEVLGVGEDSTIHRWHLQRREKISQLPGHDYDITAVDLDTSGRLAITGGFLGKIKVWDLVTDTCLKTWQAHSQKVTGLKLLPTRDKVLSAGEDGALILWNLPSGEALFRLTDLRITDIALGKDGRQAFSCSDDGLSHWDLVRASLIARYPHIGIQKIALSPDQSILAGVIKSNRLVLWDRSSTAS